MPGTCSRWCVPGLVTTAVVVVVNRRPAPQTGVGLQNAVGIDFTELPLPMMEPSRVVRKALKGLGHRSLVIPGGTNEFMDVAGKSLAPRPVLTKIYGLLLHRALETP
jgi:hypothetical protein